MWSCRSVGSAMFQEVETNVLDSNIIKFPRDSGKFSRILFYEKVVLVCSKVVFRSNKHEKVVFR